MFAKYHKELGIIQYIFERKLKCSNMRYFRHGRDFIDSNHD